MMAKSKAVTVPKYKEALLAMRHRAESNVGAAILNAHYSLPPAASRRASNGDRLEALFDGIVDAIARQIVTHAKTGEEVAMALIVNEMLVNSVHRLSCRGRA